MSTALQLLVWIDEVLDDTAKIEKRSRSITASEVPFRDCLVLDVLVVSFNRVIVVLEPVLLASYGHTEGEFRHPKKQLSPRSPVVDKPVAHKRNDFSFLRWLVTFLPVPCEHLPIACALELLEPCNTVNERSLVDKRVRKNVFCLFVDSVEIIPQLVAHMDDLLIKMDSSLECGRDCLIQRILKNPSTCAPTC